MCTVYDICDQKSFENLNNWKKEFVDYAGGSSDQLPFVLLGNKATLTTSEPSMRSKWTLGVRSTGFLISLRK